MLIASLAHSAGLRRPLHRFLQHGQGLRYYILFMGGAPRGYFKSYQKLTECPPYSYEHILRVSRAAFGLLSGEGR